MSTPIWIDSKVLGPVYRGQHGTPCVKIHSRHKAISFGSLQAAKTYAESSNNKRDIVKHPKVIKAHLRIENPFLNEPDDPFIDIALIAKKTSKEYALKIALKFGTHIMHTNNWEEQFQSRFRDVDELVKKSPEEVSELYFDAFRFFDDNQVVEHLIALGYDSAIHGGNNVTAMEAEYKVFSKEQIQIK